MPDSSGSNNLGAVKDRAKAKSTNPNRQQHTAMVMFLVGLLCFYRVENEN